MQPVVDISFDCLPLRSIARVDIPIDASPELRARSERLQQAIKKYLGENAYFLYNTHCTFRLANSDIANMLRFSFDGTVLTDRSDCKADHADLDIILVAETCDGVPPNSLDWWQGVVRQAVLIEFDHFIAEGHLAARVQQLGSVDSINSLAGFTGMNV